MSAQTAAASCGLSDEAIALLKAAAHAPYGRICYPGQIKDHWPALREAEALGYVFWNGMQPEIREAGRVAVGGPSEPEANRLRLATARAEMRPADNIHPIAAARRKPAPEPDSKTCLLCDIRGQARDKSIQIWSHGKQRAVDVPRSLIEVLNPDHGHWAAIVMPRWKAREQGLYGIPANTAAADPKTEMVDRAERAIAELSIRNWLSEQKRQQRQRDRKPRQRVYFAYGDMA